MAFNNYPYTNINDFNLDWVIKKIKELEGPGVVKTILSDGSLSVTVLTEEDGRTFTIVLNPVDTAHLMDNSVTTEKIATSAVDTRAIADNAVTNEKIATAAVSNDKIHDVSVEKLNDSTLNAGKFLRVDQNGEIVASEAQGVITLNAHDGVQGTFNNDTLDLSANADQIDIEDLLNYDTVRTDIDENAQGVLTNRQNIAAIQDKLIESTENTDKITAAISTDGTSKKITVGMDTEGATYGQILTYDNANVVWADAPLNPVPTPWPGDNPAVIRTDVQTASWTANTKLAQTLTILDEIPSSLPVCLEVQDISSSGDGSVIEYVDEDYNMVIAGNGRPILTNAVNLFQNFTSLVTIQDLGKMIFGTQSLSGLFDTCSSLRYIKGKSISCKPTVITKMFYNCSKLRSIQGSDLDFNLVTTSTNWYNQSALGYSNKGYKPRLYILTNDLGKLGSFSDNGYLISDIDQGTMCGLYLATANDVDFHFTTSVFAGDDVSMIGDGSVILDNTNYSNLSSTSNKLYPTWLTIGPYNGDAFNKAKYIEFISGILDFSKCTYFDLGNGQSVSIMWDDYGVFNTVTEKLATAKYILGNTKSTNIYGTYMDNPYVPNGVISGNWGNIAANGMIYSSYDLTVDFKCATQELANLFTDRQQYSTGTSTHITFSVV